MVLSYSSWLALTMPVFLILAALVFRRRCWCRRRRRQATGLAMIARIKQLVVLSQQHRGLSFGLLRGDGSLLERLRQVEHGVNQTTRGMLDEALPVTVFVRWRRYTEAWQGIVQSGRSLSPEANLARHTQMIEILLCLMEDIELDHFLTDQDLATQPISYLWRHLLRSAEWVGQARAMGTGFLATGGCGSVDRIRLNFVVTKIRELQKDLGRRELALSQQLQSLLEVIEADVMAGQRSELSPQDYFALASRSLDALIAVFDRDLDAALAAFKP